MGHFSVPLTSFKRPESPSVSVTAPLSKKFKLKRKRQASPEMKLITSSPPKYQDKPQPPPKKKKKMQAPKPRVIIQSGITRHKYARLNAKKNRVLETVAAFPGPATDEELNNRLNSVVETVINTKLGASEAKYEERLHAIEQTTHRTIKNLDQLVLDIGKAHGIEIAEQDQRIRDLERLNLKLISAGETMVLMTKKALDGPTSSIARIQEDVSSLLKTSTESFDSLSKALTLSTSSLMDGIANLKLDEAVPRSKGGEEVEAVYKPTSEATKPELVINLEKEVTLAATAAK